MVRIISSRFCIHFMISKLLNVTIFGDVDFMRTHQMIQSMSRVFRKYAFPRDFIAIYLAFLVMES